MGARGGHPDHGMGGTAGAGNAAGTGAESAYGGSAQHNMTGSAFGNFNTGFGPAPVQGFGQFSPYGANQFNQQQMEFKSFLDNMAMTYGMPAVQNYMDMVSNNPNSFQHFDPRGFSLDTGHSTLSNPMANPHFDGPMGFAPPAAPNSQHAFNTIFGPQTPPTPMNYSQQMPSASPMGFGPAQGAGYNYGEGFGSSN